MKENSEDTQKSILLATKPNVLFRVFNVIIMVFVCFVTIYPFIYMLANSFSSSTAILTGKVSFLPVDFSTVAYDQIMHESKFWTGYLNTIIYTTLGTFFALIINITCAYPLAQKGLYGRNVISKLVVFTMFFSGGLIPTYLVIKSLHMLNTIWALILPATTSAWNIIIMRTFFQSIPQSLSEAAEMDGLNQIQTLIRIVIPLSKPIIATICLFNAVWYWNDWFNALIYLTKENMYPVTMYLRNIMMGSTLAARAGNVDGSSVGAVSQSLQAASTMLVIFPMLLIYPHVQKYFVKGIMIGSIKG